MHSPPAPKSSESNEVNWNRFCDLLWYSEELSFWIDISRMSIKKEYSSLLEDKLQKALDSINDLEKGAIANIDENRQVGHYWLRSPKLAPTPEITSQIESEISKIKLFATDILSKNKVSPTGKPFSEVIWIGIGGSSLGPLLLTKALSGSSSILKFHFVDNIDPEGITDLLTKLGDKIQTTLFVVVSKSGSTPEPKVGMNCIRSFAESKSINWSSQSVSISMPGSLLDSQAISEDWLNRFDLPDWVGGRTSITSSVGLLAAALIGVDIDSFLEGAEYMDKLTRNKITSDNPASLLATSWWSSSQGKGLKDMVVLPYKDKLEVFSRYLQQLIMESLGKKLDKNGNVVNQGLSVFGNKGSTDQHAYVQQLRDGIDNFFVTFIEVIDDNSSLSSIDGHTPGQYLSGFLQGTRNALTEGHRQSITISMQSLSARSLGALLALFERAVSIYAEIININAYNQPGVEAGKKAANVILTNKNKILHLLSSGREMTLNDIYDQLSTIDKESIYWIVRNLFFNSNDYQIKGSWGEPNSIYVRKNL